MLTFLRRPLYVLSNKIRRRYYPGKIREEKWNADFSGPEKIPFDIKSENSYDAYPENNSLFLGLKKTNCISWVETPNHYYRNQIIESRFHLDRLGGYAAAGIMFRITDDGTYYLALASSKGYFRLDMVKNDSPRPLIGWTEVPGLAADNINFSIIACDDHLIFLSDGNWIAEIHEPSITEGRLGFALASYESGDGIQNEAKTAQGGTVTENTAYTCRAWLNSFTVESRAKKIAECYAKWNNMTAVPAEKRFRLAETFAALGAAAPALIQVTRAWEQREEAARSVTATYTETRTRSELLLAARMAMRLEKYDDAEEYFDACLEQGWDNPEGAAALAEKTNLLFALNKFTELKKIVLEQITHRKKDPALYALLARAQWNLKEYGSAAAAWDKAFELDRENGTYAVDAANAYVLLNKRDEALKRYLEGGRMFLRQDNYDELGALVPKLRSLGEHNWEVRALIGKWAFGVGDFDLAESELILSENLRRELPAYQPADPAVSYLRALLLIGKNKRKEALPFLAEAVRLAPDYGLFRFKLAETRYYLSGDAHAPGLAADLKAALSLMPDDGRVHNFAAQIRLSADKPTAGDFAAAEQHLEKAAAILGEIPVVQANQALLRNLRRLAVVNG